MARATLDEDEKRIIRAVIHSDEKRRRRQQAKMETAFDRKATAAIAKAKEELDLGEVDQTIKETIIAKIYTSLLYNTPWELMGETYCCRSLFYAYRKQFCYLVALHLDIVEAPRQQAKRKEYQKQTKK